ncbi:MAG: iron-containing alcohol dehydrogenase [Eubacteriales bacterium]|jgi:alcohol dehydrogenase YqhD (iron-dependent ADH family)
MMKDFVLRNDTRLLFLNDPQEQLSALSKGRKTLFVYGGGSVKKNGCYDDVKKAVSTSGLFFEFAGASRQLERIRDGIRLAEEKNIELVIGAGGASVMDCAKLIAFGAYHKEDLWDYIGGEKSPYGLKKLPLVLIPTYPSSGSEFGLGAVAEDTRTGNFGTAYGIAADQALLIPKYSCSLDKEMTAYSALVTLVQLSASTIGDTNPVSYDAGISIIRNVLQAAETLKEDPNNLNARGIILQGASLSTSGWLGTGKTDNYIYDLYEVEFIPEVLFNVKYRKSLTTIFPRFLKAMAKYHEKDVRTYLKDAFGLEGSLDESTERLIQLFEDIGVDMYFDGELSEEKIENIDIKSSLTVEERQQIIHDCLRK